MRGTACRAGVTCHNVFGRSPRNGTNTIVAHLDFAVPAAMHADKSPVRKLRSHRSVGEGKTKRRRVRFQGYSRVVRSFSPSPA